MPDLSNVELVGYGIGGVSFVAIAGRAALTWLGRQGLISAGDNSQKDLLTNLREDRDGWKVSYEAERAARELADRAHDDAQQQIGELKVLNLLLKSLLLQRGMTQAELDTLLGLIKNDP